MPHNHRWSRIGVNRPDGLYIPCLERDCETAMIVRGNGFIEKEGYFTSKVNGIELDIADHSTGGVSKIVMSEIMYDYDLDSIPFQDGDVVIDIGAHVGIVSIYLAKRYPGIRVISYEPMPENYRLLLRNIAKNQAMNVEPHNLAIFSKRGRVELVDMITTNSGGSSVFGTDLRNPIIGCEAITLADAMKGINRVRLLKLDCEGSEHAIVATSSPELLSRVDYIRGEIHISALMKRAGFSVSNTLEKLHMCIGENNVRMNPCSI